MSTIEEILYESERLNIREGVLMRVSELIKKKKYKHTDLKTIYELSFKEIHNKDKVGYFVN
jgi:hypothetical protein